MTDTDSEPHGADSTVFGRSSTPATSRQPFAGHLTSGDAEEEVGKVAGTEDSTPLKFHVALSPGAYLQLDDVVSTSRLT